MENDVRMLGVQKRPEVVPKKTRFPTPPRGVRRWCVASRHRVSQSVSAFARGGSSLTPNRQYQANYLIVKSQVSRILTGTVTSGMPV